MAGKPEKATGARVSPSPRLDWLRRTDGHRTCNPLRLQVPAEWSRASLGLERRRRRERQAPPPLNVVARAKALELALAKLGTEAKVARAHAMTPAGVSQYLAVVRRLPADLLAGMVVETEPARLRNWSLRTLVEIARDEGEGRRRQRLAALLAGHAT